MVRQPPYTPTDRYRHKGNRPISRLPDLAPADLARTAAATGDLHARLEVALSRIEASIDARAAAAAAAKSRHAALQSAASDAVAALDALVGDR